MMALTLAEEPWLDLAFLAFGESTAAVGADWDNNGKDEVCDLGPPRRWPPPEKGMKVDAHGAETEAVVFSPDGPAFSPSSFPVTTETQLCSASPPDVEPSSRWSGSVLVTDTHGGAWASNGPWELWFWSGPSAVDAGTDGGASGWEGGLAGGVVGMAAVLMTSFSSSSFWTLLFSKNLKRVKLLWDISVHLKAAQI